MPEELITPEIVGEQPPEGPVDSQEEYEELEAEESEEEMPQEGEDDVEEELGEPEQPPLDNVSEQRIQQLESQLQQQSQQYNTEMQQMRQYVHNMGMQREPPARQEGPLPPDMEEWSRQQLVDYSSKQSQGYANQVVRQALGPIQRVLATQNQLLEIALDSHPDKKLILEALGDLGPQPRQLDLKQALQARKGSIASQQATEAKKQLAKQSQEQRKRARKAKGQNPRPRASATNKKKFVSVEEALQLAGESIGRTT